MLQRTAVLSLFYCTSQFVFGPSTEFAWANLQSVSVTSRSCIPIFNVKYPWLRSAGATPVLQVQNVEDCKTACLMNKSCVSYQIDWQAGHSLCWIQLDAEKLVLDNMYETEHNYVTEYILVTPCGDPGVGKPTMNPNLCFPVVENKNPGWVSKMAVTAPPYVTTEDYCKTTCVAIPTCVSYQIVRNFGGVQCWLQNDQQKLRKDQLQQSETVKEYILVDRCPGSPDAEPLLNVKNAEDCKTACLINKRCVSYQIDTDPETSFCWIQLDAAKLVYYQMYDRSSVTEYILINRCSDPGVDKPTIKPDTCSPIFENKNPGWVSQLAVYAPDAKTEDDCKATCVSIPTCLSYQIIRNFGGVHCWLQYDQQKLRKDQLHQSETVKEYILVDRCPESPDLQRNYTVVQGQGQQQWSSVTLVTKEQTFRKLNQSTEDASKCLPVFENKNPGRVSRQATSAPNAKTEDECKNTCIRIPACVSYLISRKAGAILCWLQYNQQQLNKEKLIQSGTVEEYILVDRCKVSTEYTEKDCTVTMKPSMYGQLSGNATPYTTAKDERSCVAACIARSDCISVQFKFSDKNWLCFLQQDFHAFKPGNLIHHPNVTEHVVIKKCNKTNACSQGFPLKRLGGPMYLRVRRNSECSRGKGKCTNKRGISSSLNRITGLTSLHGSLNVTDVERDCEVLVQPVNYGLSTPEGMPFKSALTDEDCIGTCIADMDCISTQHQRHSSDGSFACFLVHDLKAFNTNKLLYRPDVTQYIIRKRCDKTIPV